MVEAVANPLCRCCSGEAVTYGPHRECKPMFSAEDMARFTPAEQQIASEQEAAYRWRSAYHEAGHAVAAIATGRAISYATIGGGQPHLSYLPQTPPADASLTAYAVRSISGSLAEGIYDHRLVCPPAETLRAFIERARGDHSGSCDRCSEAQILVVAFGSDPDEEIAEKWRTLFKLTLGFIDHDEVRFNNLRRVAVELWLHTLLTGEEIAALVDADELRRAYQAAVDEWSMETP